MAVNNQISSADFVKPENHCQEIIENQTPKKCFLVGGVELVAEDDQNGIDDDHEVMILTPLSAKGNNKQDPICVEDYQESRGSYPNSGSDHIEAAAGVKVKTEKPYQSSSSSKKRSKPFKHPSVTEKGEASNSRSIEVETVFVEEVERIGAWKKFECEICAESKLQIDAFAIKGCTHSYCLDCINNLIVTKLDEGFSNVSCPAPDCPGMLEPDYCRDIIPSDVFNRWGDALCESVIDASQKFYCPFKDCSALFILDGDENITTSECPTCHRLFCVQCKDVWHAGIECSEYQKLGKGERGREDIMLRQLAQSQKWQRCPSCKFYVERIDGCLFMKCRCKVAFCYFCGKILKDESNHYCSNCQR